MLGGYRSPPQAESHHQKQAKRAWEKTLFVLTYILMVFLLYEVLKPEFEVTSLFSAG
jgi:hypothetical protein